MPAVVLLMDPSDRSEIVIAAMIFGVFIAYIIRRHICDTIPGLCMGAWAIFGVIFIAAVAFLMLRIFKA